MNRISKINKRLLDYKIDNANTGANMDAEHEFETNAKDDIEYLLSRLEIAETALDLIVYLSNDATVYEAAKKALQQIRQ